MSNFDVVKPVGSNLDLRIEIRNDTWKLTNNPNGALDMEPATKLALIRGLLSDKDECKGWNTMVMQYYPTLMAGLQVLSPYKVLLTLPVLSDFNIRVPETISLTVPGFALTPNEDISPQQEGLLDNTFLFRPDSVAAESREVYQIADGQTIPGELEYFPERWFTFNPGQASLVLRIDSEYNTVANRYGALQLQVYEDNSLQPSDYSQCGYATTACSEEGTTTANAGGGAAGSTTTTEGCRCIRADITQGVDTTQGPQSTLLLERDNVIYATPSLGYTAVEAAPRASRRAGRLWFSVRCVVDVCNGRCRFNMSVTRLPHMIDDGDAISAPIESGSWQFFKGAPRELRRARSDINTARGIRIHARVS